LEEVNPPIVAKMNWWPESLYIREHPHQRLSPGRLTEVIWCELTAIVKGNPSRSRWRTWTKSVISVRHNLWRDKVGGPVLSRSYRSEQATVRLP